MEIPIRELKSHLSRYLAQAQAGAVIVVTSHKKFWPTSRASRAWKTVRFSACLTPGW
jgi:hypothetical protein